jgi:hypothetical protein
MAEPLVPEPNRLEAEIPSELIRAGGEILLFAIHKLINSIWNKKELPDQRKESIIVPVHKKSDKSDCNKGLSSRNIIITYEMGGSYNKHRGNK